tara:strand:+ start:5753 stop:5968 length:216 start_codon:yes stop_codon:yes gene_type:complete
MKYRRISKSGLRFSELSFSSWVTFGDQVNNAVAESCLKTAYDAGINFFDSLYDKLMDKSNVAISIVKKIDV